MKHLLASTAILIATTGTAFAEAHSMSPFAANAEGEVLYASDLVGARLYVSETEAGQDLEERAEWDDVGEISDIIVGKDGEVQQVLADIGGFLGIGEKRIAVSMESLQFVSDGEDSDEYFIVISGTREALENAPTFERMMDDAEETAEAAGTEMEQEAEEMTAEADAAAENVEQEAEEMTAEADAAAEELEQDTEQMAAEAGNEIENVDEEVAAAADEAAAETEEAMAEAEAEITNDQSEEVAMAEAEVTEEQVEGEQEVAAAEDAEEANEEMAEAQEEVQDAEEELAEEQSESMTDEQMASDENMASDEQMAAADSEGRTMFTAPTIEREGYETAAYDTLTTEDVTGARVYDANDEWIGEVNSLVMSDDGTLSEAIIDVGGFLGLGEKQVALTMEELTIQRGDGDLRIYLDATEEQLNQLPEWEG